jgi:tellurite resistance protein TerC
VSSARTIDSVGALSICPAPRSASIAAGKTGNGHFLNQNPPFAPTGLQAQSMTSVGTPFMWLLFAAFVLAALCVDFMTMRRQGAHRVSMREAAVWSLTWVVVSFVFVGWLWWYLGGAGPDAAVQSLARDKVLEFITGYGLEKALAMDNIFVFLMIFSYFGVPAEFQKRALMIGILGALFLRTALILIGAWAIAQFHWILYLFGAFLVYTGIRMWSAGGQEPELEANPALRWVRRRMQISLDFDGERFFTSVAGVRMLTPLAIVILLIGIVDVVFAVDSIPAVFAITTDPFIVLTSNVFAVLGLRALYFLLVHVHERFHLLSYGLAFLLVFIGIKLLLMDVYKIPAAVSLLVTTGVLVFTMVLSVYIPATGRPRGPPSFPAKRSREEQKE